MTLLEGKMRQLSWSIAVYHALYLLSEDYSSNLSIIFYFRLSSAKEEMNSMGGDLLHLHPLEAFSLMDNSNFLTEVDGIGSSPFTKMDLAEPLKKMHEHKLS